MAEHIEFTEQWDTLSAQEVHRSDQIQEITLVPILPHHTSDDH